MNDSFNKKKKYFSFAKINKYFIFPFLSPIFIFIREILLEHAKGKTSGIRKILQYEFNDGLMHSACILLYIIIYYRTRRAKNFNEDYKKFRIKSISSNDKKRNNNKLKVGFIIILDTTIIFLVKCF